MKVRKWAEFVADFPDDQVDDGNDISQFGGRNVAETVVDILKSLGCTAEDPEVSDHYGWSVAAKIRDTKIWCEVTSLPPGFILSIEENSLRKGYDYLFADVLIQFHQALIGDGRFHDIVWKTQEEMDDPEGTGSPEPVTESPEPPGGWPEPRDNRTASSSKPWWKKLLGLN